MSGDDAAAASGGDTTYTASSFEPTPGFTQTRYDPGTMSRTDVDVVMEDIEQQLSIRPAEERANKSRDMKLLCIFLLLVAVAVSVGLSVSKKGNVETETSTISLAAPPDYITSVCSPDMIALKSGRKKCEELCEVAVCCFVPETDKVSCKQNNEAVCREYVAVCGNLDAESAGSGGSEGDTGTSEGTDQPDDPTADEAGAVDEEEGKETDSGAEDGVEEGKENTSTTGDQEGSNGPPAETDDLKAAIESSCKADVISSTGGTAACEALCGPGSCCFSSGEQTCESTGINVDCGEYAACAIIYASDTAAEATKEEVDAACKGGVTKTPEGLAACQKICEQGACCFAHGDEYCLNAGLDVDCVHFGACEVLHREDYYDDEEDEEDKTDANTAVSTKTTASVETAANGDASEGDTSSGATKAQIDEACLQDLSNSEWKFKCEELCLRGKCCYDTPQSSCGENDEGERIECSDFTSCSGVFQDDNGGEDSASKMLAEKCSEASLAMPGGEDACMDACVGSECCFSDNPDSCTLVDCVDYSICSAVFGADDTKSGTGGEGEEDQAATEETEKGSNEETELATAEKVIETCQSENLMSEIGRSDCEKLCINHLCCFATENDCRESLGAECLEFAACKALVDWSQEP